MAVEVPNLAASRSLHRDVEAYVLELIRTGEARPGDHLSEVEIARRLQISRTPVREAFARLLRDGVLEHSPRRGAFVPQPSPERVAEVASLRAVLEGFGARLACARITPAEIGRLQALVEAGAIAGASGDWLSMEERNAEFHDFLIHCAQHELLLRAWRLLTPAGWKLIAATPHTSPSAAIVSSFRERHGRIVAALASGDPQCAERVAHDHVSQAGERLLGQS